MKNSQPKSTKKESSKSPSPKVKPVNRKDKQQLKQKHRLQLQQARIQRQKQQAQLQLRKLHDSGIVQAYQTFLRNICKNGLPQPSNVYEMAAQHVLKFGKKLKQKQQMKDQIFQYNSEALKAKKQRI